MHELDVKYNRVPCLSCAGSDFGGHFCLHGCLKLEFGGICVCVNAKCNTNASLVILPEMNFGIAPLIQSMNQIFCCHWSSWAHQTNNKIKKPKHKFLPALNESSRVNSDQCSSIILFSVTWWSSFWRVVVAEVLSFSTFLSRLSFCIIMCSFLRTFRLSDNLMILSFNPKKVIFKYKETLKTMSLILHHDEMQCIIVSLNNRNHLDGGQLQYPGLGIRRRQNRQHFFH